MLAENEVVSLLLSLGILLFIWANLWRIREIGGYRYLLSSFLAYVIALIFTLLEGIVWEPGFNFLEHLGYMVSAALLAIWIARPAWLKRGEG